jgi:hypothetical protein
MGALTSKPALTSALYLARIFATAQPSSLVRTTFVAALAELIEAMIATPVKRYEATMTMMSNVVRFAFCDSSQSVSFYVGEGAAASAFTPSPCKVKRAAAAHTTMTTCSGTAVSMRRQARSRTSSW